MKQTTHIAAAFLALLAVAAGCAKDDKAVELQYVRKVSFVADNFIEADSPTRTILDGSTFMWAANDTVGIYPNAGSQIFFAMAEGAGTNSAVFDGGGWAFRSGSVYYSYYPFIADFYLNRNSIPVSYTDQHQNGPSNLSHFGKYDYMFADRATEENYSISFNYHHLGCVIRVNATLEPGTYRQVTITAPTAVFTLKGHFDLESESPAIITDESGKELTVVLDNFTITEKGTYQIYLMSAPVDLAGTEITVSIVDSGKKQYDCKKTPSRPYEAPGIYGLSCTSWTEVPQTVGLAIADWGEGGSISGTAD